MGRTPNHGLRSGDDGVIGSQAAVGASTRFDDFNPEQSPNPFRLAALLTHDAEAAPTSRSTYSPGCVGAGR